MEHIHDIQVYYHKSVSPQIHFTHIALTSVFSFYYFSDADAAAETRIRIGWKNSGSWFHCLPI